MYLIHFDNVTVTLLQSLNLLVLTKYKINFKIIILTNNYFHKFVLIFVSLFKLEKE